MTTVPGGLGGHKWADRRLLSALAAAGGEPLLCDLDGLVLEAARANVFIVEPGGPIVTPPADGRILPGVTRELVIGLGPARPCGPRRADRPGSLAGARELFLTGALAGVEPAQLGRPPATEG